MQTIIQSNFMRSYKVIQEQKKEYQKMPDDIKQLLPADNQWSTKFKTVDLKREEEEVVITYSEIDFIEDQMEQLYISMGKA